VRPCGERERPRRDRGLVGLVTPHRATRRERTKKEIARRSGPSRSSRRGRKKSWRGRCGSS
jgi:hypothetical protein